MALGQHVRAHLALGRAALRHGQAAAARAHFEAALTAPSNLGEARHPLANPSEIRYELGRAFAALGQTAEARAEWAAAAAFRGDFQAMRVQSVSELTYYSARAAEKLGRHGAAREMFRQILRAARALAKQRATIDYFATSLPTMLLFHDDLAARQQATAWLWEAQAWLGLGRTAAARGCLRRILQRDPNHALAADLMVAGKKSV